LYSAPDIPDPAELGVGNKDSAGNYVGNLPGKGTPERFYAQLGYSRSPMPAAWITRAIPGDPEAERGERDYKCYKKSIGASSYPEGVLEVFQENINGFVPVCGNMFWDNPNGVEMACKKMGYEGGHTYPNEPVDVLVESVYVGGCDPNEAPGSCSNAQSSDGCEVGAPCDSCGRRGLKVTCTGTRDPSFIREGYDDSCGKTLKPTPTPTLEPTPPPSFHPDCGYESGISGTDDCPNGGYAHIYDPEECKNAAKSLNYKYKGDEQDVEFNPTHPMGCYLYFDPRDPVLYFNGPRSMSPEEVQAYLLEEHSGTIESDYYKPVCGKCPGDTAEPTAAPTGFPTPEPSFSEGFGGCPDEGNDPAAQKGTYEIVTLFGTAPRVEHSDGQFYSHQCGGIAMDTCNRIYWGEMWMDTEEDGDSAVYRFPVDKMSPMPVDMIHKEQLFPKELVGWGLAVYQYGINKPRFIVLRPGNWIYSCDYQRVFKFHPGDWQAVLVAGGQGEGNEDNQIGLCEAIAFDKEDRFYVSDSWNNRVNRYQEGDHTQGSGTADATLVAGPGEKQYNERVMIAGTYIQPRGNAILNDGSVLVVCYAGSRVIRWTPMTFLPPSAYSNAAGYGYYPGQVIAGAKGHGCETNQLNRPHGLTTYEYEGKATMYIMDTGCNRVQEWDVGQSTGQMIAGQPNPEKPWRGTKGHWDAASDSWVVADDQLMRGEIIIFHRGWLYITDGEQDKIVRWGTGHR
jgi:hypothetical protein